MAKFQNKRNHKMQGKFPLSPPQKNDPTKPHAKRQFQRTQKYQSRLAQNQRAENYEDDDKTKKQGNSPYRHATMPYCQQKIKSKNTMAKFHNKRIQKMQSKFPKK